MACKVNWTLEVIDIVYLLTVIPAISSVIVPRGFVIKYLAKWMVEVQASVSCTCGTMVSIALFE